MPHHRPPPAPSRLATTSRDRAGGVLLDGEAKRAPNNRKLPQRVGIASHRHRRTSMMRTCEGHDGWVRSRFAVVPRRAASLLAATAITACSSTPSNPYVSADQSFGTASPSFASASIGPAYSVDSSSAAFGGMYDTRQVSADQLVQAQKQQTAQSRQQALAAQREMMQWGQPETPTEEGYVKASSEAYAAWKSQNGL